MDQNECKMQLDEDIFAYRDECKQLVGNEECTEQCYQIETTDQNVLDACLEDCGS